MPELYYLRQGLQESVFPQSVCKYFEDGGHDTECPGLEAARAAGNPLKFVVSVREFAALGSMQSGRRLTSLPAHSR